MTQMGLDYQKHQENIRHNLVTEATNQQDADTRKYTASFKPREVAASELKASADAYKASFEGDKLIEERRKNTLNALKGTKATIGVLDADAALAYLIGEGLIDLADLTKPMADKVKQALAYDNNAMKKAREEAAEKFRTGATTAWNTNTGSFR